MKKRVIAVTLTLAICLSVFTGCKKKETDSKPAIDNNVPAEIESTESHVQEEEQTVDDDLSQLEAIGDVDVDKGIFDVTITLPKDIIGDTTQEELDQSVKEKGFKSATLNSDGSATYVMTKAQHKEMLAGIRESIDNSISEMIGSSDCPNITNVEANDNYTSFTITTKNKEPDLSESYAVLVLYVYGRMYGIFEGEDVDNVHVDYVNADSGEIISSANSRDMGNDE